jgi:ATP-dependent RNA helicase MRH4, mitochondrial
MRTLLADVSAARGSPIPVPVPGQNGSASSQAHGYPFHLLLTSATIPSSLASYLTVHHPTMARLTSPRLHRLPASLRAEHISYGSARAEGGSTQANAIERRLRAVWADDVEEGRPESKILVFANSAGKVGELTAFLDSRGIRTVGLSGASEARKHGSNAHLNGFLKRSKDTFPMSTPTRLTTSSHGATGPAHVPHVLVTTSLLSRGLDFSPDVRHVFVADAPRNMVDFLHRAGRAGRAGAEGKVVMFAKDKGRGSEAGREVRKKVRAIV